MTTQQAIWIAEQQIWPNVYGLKAVALLELIAIARRTLEAEAATSSPVPQEPPT